MPSETVLVFIPGPRWTRRYPKVLACLDSPGWFDVCGHTRECSTVLACLDNLKVAPSTSIRGKVLAVASSFYHILCSLPLAQRVILDTQKSLDMATKTLCCVNSYPPCMVKGSIIDMLPTIYVQIFS